MREAAAMKNAFLSAFALALLQGSPALASVATVAAPVPIQRHFTPAQLSHYAAALVELEQVGAVLTAREASLPTAQREALARQAGSEKMAIVQRNDLDPATFNAISKAVEADPALRMKIHQAMMDKVIGT